MTTLALPFHSAARFPISRSVTHKLALALVWMTVACGAVVFSEPAPIDVLTMGLIVLLPVVGLVAISPTLVGLLALWLVAAAAGVLAATNAVDIGTAITHTAVSFYLYVATFVFAAFVAKRPQAHAQLIFNAYTWAAIMAAVTGIVGYFDLLPGAYELMTRYGRATGLFKDPNVFGPFLVPALVYALSRLVGAPLRKAVVPLGVFAIVGFAMLLSFSRGAWINLAVAATIYGALHFLTARRDWLRLKFAALAMVALLLVSGLVAVAMQFDAIANLFAERASLTQSYDEGPDGRFGGQEKAAGLIIAHPFGIGAQQFAPHYHHEEPHNVYLTMFLNAGWLGGLIFLGLLGSTTLCGLRHALVHGATQPLFLVAYACFVANVCEGVIIDIDHWRHLYLLMALTWGLMLGKDVIAPLALRAASYRFR